MDDNERFKYTRNAYMKKVAQARAELDQLLASNDYVNAEIKIDVISNFLHEIDMINESLVSTVNSEAELDMELGIKDEVIGIKCDVNAKLRGLQASSAPPAATQGYQRDDKEYSGQVRVKLPTLQISIFSGQYQDWLGWSQQFESAIGQNTRLSNIDRFNYLKSFLSGRALEAVEGIPISNENYPNAWKILQQRFSSPRLIIKSLLKDIIPKVPVASDLQGLKNIYSKYEITWRNIKIFASTGINGESVGFVFSILLEWQLQDTMCLDLE